jgi:hypothetical protein
LLVNDGILWDCGGHYEEIVDEHLLLVLRKVLKLKLKLEPVIAFHNMLVVVVEQEPVSVETTLFKRLFHDVPSPYTLTPCLEFLPIIEKVHA